MRKNLLLFILLSTVSFSNVLSQSLNKCYTVEMEKQKYKNLGLNYDNKMKEFESWMTSILQKNAFSKTNGDTDQVLYIPVVIHVIHNGEAVGTGSNISYAQIQSQIDVLNEDFRKLTGTPGYNTHPDGADTKIEFVLAKRTNTGVAFAGGEDGVDRVDRNTMGFSAPAYTTGYINSNIKPATIWDPTIYLNMWTCSISGGILGYAQFPETPQAGMNCNAQSASTDGLVMGYQYFGSTDKGSFPSMVAPYDKGRTATHELGHQFGLRHIWGDGACGVDDYCSDTPESDAANFNCPIGHTSCSSTDMIENYMDYTDDDCMNIFTEQQKARMRAVIFNSPRRKSLLSSIALIPPTTNDAGIVDIKSPLSQTCGTTIQPIITLKNFGGVNLTSATIKYQIDGGAVQTYSYAGTLTPNSTTDITLTSSLTTTGSHVLTVYSELPNTAADDYTSNDTMQLNFLVNDGLVPPYTQTFEANFPPEHWYVNDPDDDCYTWYKQGVYADASGNAGSAAHINFFDYSGSGQLDELISPVFDINTATSATLTFDVAYAQASDRLQVFVSTDCGVTYNAVAIYDKTGAPLATVAASASQWFPSASGNWRNETVDLSAYVGNSIRLKFVGTNASGNSIFVDNVNVTSVIPAGPYISFAGSSTNITESTSAGTGCRTYTDITVNVQIGMNPSVDADVTVGIASSTASDPADYEIITPMPIIFTTAGATSIPVTIRIYDDKAIESAENIVLNYSLNANGGNAAADITNQTHTITITDDDVAPVGGTITLFSEDFESGAIGWTELTNTTSQNTWRLGTMYNLSGSQSAYVTRDAASTTYRTNDNCDKIYSTPAINATGITGMTLDLVYQCNGEIFSGTIYDYGQIYYSLDQSTWTPLSGQIQGITSTTTYSTALPTAVENTSFYIGFRWVNDGSAGTAPAFVIDDVQITYPGTVNIASTTGQSKSEYLGPQSIVYFQDAGTGDLICTIENTSSHDFGCTTVQIDRDGTSATLYYNTPIANALCDKTIIVSPATNNASAAYTMTMYYTGTEKSGWESATGNTWSSIEMVKTGGSIDNITPSTPTANGATNYTATGILNGTYGTSDAYVTGDFATGFSGFGVGIPGSTPLPIEMMLSGKIVDAENHLTLNAQDQENIQAFTLENSHDGLNFDLLQSFGSENSKSEYKLLDQSPILGKNYYRIKAMDLDGETYFSNLVLLTNQEETFTFGNIYPIPAKNTLNVDFSHFQNEKLSIELIDLLGKTILKEHIQAIKGGNSIQLNVSEFSSGVYTVKLMSPSNEIYKKIIIQN